MPALLRKRNPEGRMTLADHLRELRNRLFFALGAMLIGAVLGWIFYEPVLSALTRPLTDIANQRRNEGDGGIVNINFGGLTDPLAIQLTVAVFIGLVLSSPIWLLQIWGFIVPGLTKKEKRVTRVFVVAAVPLFLLGCALAFFMLPKAVSVLLGFTPEDAVNLQDASVYLTFVLKFIVAFGCAFLLPVFLVAFNLVGILPATAMLKAWRPAVMIICVFAAIMTPTPDAYTMLVLATPMVALYFVAVGIAFLFDRKKEKEQPDWLDVPDDQASAL
ncbi:twin-arginine translocase subunit TatC [Terracoccus luteus]|uniref:Sec-independent protein translocase protein TatC n=1 Tax=Terracoccus luteus TaxID=53356 RepID=A0A495XXZ3_9MICO|nr:twin-arginine translocase subunit TatC [Terracoccus luteus]MBB2987631.1 sec-independent protein translocase protein TatC [Terracoccus luteus]MCP2173282.1 sec-independent protein translocase protein TatC [Terracoccus luteus]RKT78025.1 sec-independent protein translocase protein TatC [Terracoccus luteus]